MRFAVAPLAALVLSLPAAAQDTYKVDAAHSEVTFKVRYLVGKVSGSFGAFSGTVVVDEQDPAKSSVDFTIQAASINTNNEARDKHLRTADFFEVEKHPTLTFKSVSVKEVAKGKLEVTGDFTLRGVTKRITVPVSNLGASIHPRSQKVNAAFQTAFTIQRKDYGMNYGLTDAANIVVGNEVDIELTILAEKQGK